MNYEQLRDWKNHYRGLISSYNSKLVEIRKWVERNRDVKGKGSWVMVPLSEWQLLEELVKRELLHLPPKDVIAFDQTVDSGLLQLSLLRKEKT